MPNNPYRIDSTAHSLDQLAPVGAPGPSTGINRVPVAGRMMLHNDGGKLILATLLDRSGGAARLEGGDRRRGFQSRFAELDLSDWLECRSAVVTTPQRRARREGRPCRAAIEDCSPDARQVAA
jgi:hypothetical protein